MKNPILRSIGSILLSLAVAILLLASIEGIGAVLYPFPADFDGTREAVAEQVANYPSLILFLVGVVGWWLTMVIACWLATRYGANRHPAHGIGVGVLLLAGALFNISQLPYPLWFTIAEVITLPLGIYAGVFLAKQRSN